MKPRKKNSSRWLENRKGLILEYRVWYWGRLVKIVLLLIICFFVYFLFTPSKDVLRPFNNGLANAVLGFFLIVLWIILLIATSVAHEVQKTSQNCIDRYMLENGETSYHFAEILPFHKGIRMHKAEHRLYKRRVRYFKRLICKKRREA